MLAIALPLWGCADSTATRQGSSSGCSTDSDCARGESCEGRRCVDDSESRGRTPRGDDGSDSTGDAGRSSDAGSDDAFDAGSSTDATTGTDTGAPDTITSSDTGSGGGETCTEHGGGCSLAEGSTIRDDGDYWCLARGDGSPPSCAAKCGESFSASTCDEGSFCFDIGSTSEILACIDSDCTSWRNSARECSGGTCVAVGNDATVCLSAGPIAQGASCPTSPSSSDELCAPGLWCIGANPDATTGVCRPLCDFWSSSSSCTGGQACALLTEDQGVCAPSVGGEPLMECADPGGWCGDRTRCITFGAPPETLDACATYCRRGQSDCVAVRPGGTSTVCNWNVFADSVQLGLCLPPCSASNPCPGAADRCISGVCVEECSSDGDCSSAGDRCLSGVCKPRPT